MFFKYVCVRPINLHLSRDHSQLTLFASNLCGSLQREHTAACRKTLQKFSRPRVWHHLKAPAQSSVTHGRSVCLSGCLMPESGSISVCWLTSLGPHICITAQTKRLQLQFVQHSTQATGGFPVLCCDTVLCGGRGPRLSSCCGRASCSLAHTITGITRHSCSFEYTNTAIRP